MTSASTRPILFVGSVPLGTPQNVLETLGSTIGPLAKRYPDGETGARANWIVSQEPILERTAGLEFGGERQVNAQIFKLLQFAKGYTAKDIKLPSLNYALFAIESYSIFKGLRDEGKVPAGTRFQVSLPSAFGVVSAFFMPHAVRDFWPVYEQKMFEEVDEIARAIPHKDLAIQWDIAVEICTVLARPELPIHKVFSMDELARGIARGCDRVPADIEVGLHFCYGEPGHKHIVEPIDMSLMVDLIHAVQKHVRRPIGWLHMPVPRDRDDDAYFMPLKDLKLDPATELYLGLVHRTGGIEGNKRRLATAKKFVFRFGIATECGLGQRPPDTIPEVLALYREVAQLG